MRLSRLLVCMPAFACAWTAPALAAETGAELYAGFTLLDPVAQKSTPDSWLIVRGTLIESMGFGLPPAGDFAVVHDVSGLFGLAGLIDAHGHITAGPQRITVEDGAPRVEITSGDEYSRMSGAVALAYGTTTVRNPGGSTTANARYDAMIESGEWLGPEARHAGAILQPPPFVGESFAYPRTAEEWDEEAARQAAAGMTYFKLYIGLTEDDIASGVAAAKAHGLVPIAHLNAVSWTRAAELGVKQIEHALPTSADLLEPAARALYAIGPDYMTRWFELADYDGPLMREMIATLVARGVAVDLTLIVNQLIYHADDIDGVFPEAMALHPKYIHPDFDSMLVNYEAMAAVPAEQLARGRAVWPKVLELARVLHDAGVPLMLGTDAAGGGPWLAYELANHVRAGLSPFEVLRIATAGNASAMNLIDTGRVAPGMQADLVFLRADPTLDIERIREVELVVSNGRAYEPATLLELAAEIAAAARARSPD